MKKLLSYLMTVLVVCACEHDVTTETDFNVMLDSENTYVAGEPVTFNISGTVDNILFYSGEQGHAYEFCKRFSVPMEDVKDVALSLDIQARYGSAGGMDIYISKDFSGLSGNGEEDRSSVKQMVAGGMEGWQKLDFEEGVSTEWKSFQYGSLGHLKESFSIAFHWNPEQYKKDDAYLVQRTYWVNGRLDLDIDDMPASSIDLSELLFTTLVMNEEVMDPYHKNAGNGSIILNAPETADLIFQGVAPADSLDYAIDAWAFSTPLALNHVANDKGVVIKNQQNYLESYSYVWTEPGTYKVTFVGTNADYLDSSQEICEMEVIIIPDVD